MAFFGDAARPYLIGHLTLDFRANGAVKVKNFDRLASDTSELASHPAVRCVGLT